jgi:aryl-alcohol dehydrogenase-like predicted oxidoreductase
MRYLTIGGRDVSVIGLGAWQFGSTGWGWGRDFGEREAQAIVRRALDLGVTLFDTAEVYGRGESERVLGEALGHRRPDAFLATKVWPLHALGFQVQSALAKSLSRLGTQSVELYQMHWPNPAVPLKWTMAGMREARKRRLVDNVGVSNFGLARWRQADKALGAPVVSNQVPYNLLQRDAEHELIPFARANDRIVIAYSPLAQGLLTGRYGTYNVPGGYRRLNKLFLEENIRRAQPVLDTLSEVADAHHASLAQIALAWTIRGSNVVAIPGAKSVRQLEENVGAAEIALADDEVFALSTAANAFDPISRRSNARDMVRRLATPLSSPFSLSGRKSG